MKHATSWHIFGIFVQSIFNLEITNSRAAFLNLVGAQRSWRKGKKEKGSLFGVVVSFSTDMHITNLYLVLFLLLDFIGILLLIIILSLLFLLLLDLIPAAGSTVKSCEDEGMYNRSWFQERWFSCFFCAVDINFTCQKLTTFHVFWAFFWSPIGFPFCCRFFTPQKIWKDGRHHPGQIMATYLRRVVTPTGGLLITVW